MSMYRVLEVRNSFMMIIKCLKHLLLKTSIWVPNSPLKQTNNYNYSGSRVARRMISSVQPMLWHLYSTTPDRTTQPHICNTSTAHVQSLHYIYCTYLVRTPSCMATSNQYTISPVHVQSVHHLSCSCPVNTPSLLPISSENPISPGHVRSIHLSCSCPVRMLPKALCPCHVRIPSFLRLSTQRWNICQDKLDTVLRCAV